MTSRNLAVRATMHLLFCSALFLRGERAAQPRGAHQVMGVRRRTVSARSATGGQAVTAPGTESAGQEVR